MNRNDPTKDMLNVKLAGTFDSASPVEVLKAVDLAMRQYFDANDWLTVRNRLFPGLRHLS